MMVVKEPFGLIDLCVSQSTHEEVYRMLTFIRAEGSCPVSTWTSDKKDDIPCRRAAHATATSVRPRDFDMVGLTV